MAHPNIQIQARLRPHKPSDGILVDGALEVGHTKIKAVNPRGNALLSFKLDKCLGMESTQQDIFSSIAPMLESVFSGVNACVFAYGVTGAGKTHTMEGSVEDPGVIPRAVGAVLARARDMKKAEVAVSFSYVEILKDEVYDLLGESSSHRVKLDVRNDERGHATIIGRERMIVNDLEEFVELYGLASKNRKTASTKLNNASSRSHAILTIHLDIVEEGDRRLNEICLVDLAGSENNNLTGNVQERMRESAAINKSLAALGNVVEALQRGAAHVPYRDSKLTRILSHALGGPSLALLLVCLAPGEKFSKDTINTLKFADRASKVVNTMSLQSRVNAPHPRRSSAIALASSTTTAKPNLPAIPRASKTTSAIARINVLADSTSNQPIACLPTHRPAVVEPVKASANHSAAVIEPAPRAKREAKENQKHIERERDLSDTTIDKIAEIVADKIHVSALEPSETVPLGEHLIVSNCAPPSKENVPVEDDKRAKARVWTKKGKEAQQAGDLRQALQCYRAALEIMPDRIPLRNRVLQVQYELEHPLMPIPALRRTRDEVDGEATAAQSPPVRRKLEYARGGGNTLGAGIIPGGRSN